MLVQYEQKVTELDYEFIKNVVGNYYSLTLSLSSKLTSHIQLFPHVPEGENEWCRTPRLAGLFLNSDRNMKEVLTNNNLKN